mmetsp:Transcript_14354/g.24436  ORF Transcript_14354/g.24436 Transcript_14354/m.24436 type:complete len:122 (-) Transcript_14354:139-504(-)
MLGTISKAELSEAEQMNPSVYSLGLSSSVKTPVYAWNIPALLLSCGAGAAYCGFALVVKRYSMIWAPAALLPFAGTLLFNHKQQPRQHILSVLDYILQKRLATVEMESFKAQLDASNVAQE